jgi:hypothetical protein
LNVKLKIDTYALYFRYKKRRALIDVIVKAHMRAKEVFVIQ